MNTQPKPIKVLQCSECPDSYMMVGDVPIRLAKPCCLTTTNTGTCPKHRKPS